MRQTTRTLLSLLLLSLVAGGLGLYAWFGVVKPDEAEAERKAIDEQVFALQKPEERAPDGGALEPTFLSVTVKAKGETTVLVRGEDGEWRITSPLRARVDKLAVDGLLSQVQTAKFKLKVEDAPDDAALERYGLKSPSFSVSAKARVSEGERELVLHGGIDNSFDGSVYLRREGDPAVYSAEGGVRWSLEKTTYDLRDKELLSFEEPKVQAIEVAGRFSLKRDEKKAWQLTQPLSAAADGPTVTSLLSVLRSERALSFHPDTPEKRAELGLDKPQVDATIALEGGEKVRLRLAKGGPERAYALREDSAGTSLAEVNGSALAAFDKSPGDLRDRSVLSFDKEAVMRIAFRLEGGEEIVVERASADGGSVEDWNVVAPTQKPAKKWKLSSLLWTLGSLRATKLGEPNPRDWGRYGIGPKSRGAALLGEGGKELARLALGKEVPGEPGKIYARGTRDEIAELDASRLSELPAALSDVVDEPKPDAN